MPADGVTLGGHRRPDAGAGDPARPAGSAVGRRPRAGRAGPRGRPARGRPADLAGRGRDARRCARSPRALAPHTGHAQVVGLTGSPGVGKSTTTTALVRALRAGGQRVGVLAVDPSRRSPAARCSATGCGCRTTPPTGRLHPLDGHPRAPRRAGRGDAAGAAGAGRRRLRRGPGRDRRRRAGRGGGRLAGRHHAGAARARAWATPSRRPRPASWRSPTSSWSTRPTGTAPTRPCATCGTCIARRAALRGRRTGGRRSCKTVASREPQGHRRGRWPRSRSTATGWSRSGELHRRRERAGRRRDRGDRPGRAARADGRRARLGRARRRSPRGSWRGRPTRTGRGRSARAALSGRAAAGREDGPDERYSRTPSSSVRGRTAWPPPCGWRPPGCASRSSRPAERPGGGMRTEELMRPGYHHDVCSIVQPMAAAAPFFREFDPQSRGVRLVLPEINFAHPLDGGRAAVSAARWRRPRRGLGADGAAYRRLFGPLVEHGTDVVDFFLTSQLRRPPTRSAAADRELRAERPAQRALAGPPVLRHRGGPRAGRRRRGARDARPDPAADLGARDAARRCWPTTWGGR